MKQFNTIFKKSFSAFAVMLFGITASFAQVVTVPAGCVVKVPGTGGSIALNQVGDGGVVAMPDNFAGATFTCTTPAGYVLTGWLLKGDLSVTTANIPPTAPTQSAGSVSSVSIQSYNKKLRSSEGAAGTPASKLAKSKGSISIGYNAGACSGYTMSFEVYKTYTTTPPIVGPDCVEAGVPCTFSVDQVASDNAGDNIGFDQYYWSDFPTTIVANSLYYSADNSSITFTPTVSGSFNIKCCLGRANPWDAGTNVNGTLGTTCAIKAVGAAPSEPVYTVSPAGLCVATGTATSFTITYTSPNTCTWTAANTGWTIGAQTPTSVTINTNGFNNPGILTLSVSNGTCTPLTFQYQINRSFAAPVVIAPVIANNNCLATGSTNNMFNISTSAAANPTTWTVSPAGTGVTLATGTTSSTVAVNVSPTATVGAYTLTARSTSCTGNITYSFRVKPVIPTISGTSCVVKGALTPQTYTCLASPGATYTWSFPSGWTASNFTTTTNSITVTPSSTTAILNGNVSVTANGIVGCNSTANNLTIGYTSAAPTGVTPGCFSVGIAGSTSSVTITNPLSGSYTATMISTVTGSTNVITSALTLSGSTLSFTTSALAAGTYNLAITHNSGCGAAATSTTLVTVAGNGTTLSPNLGVSQDNYFAIAPATMVNPQYEWTTCTSSGVCTTVGSNSALLSLSGSTAPPAGNQVCVTVYPLGSTCKTRLCTAQGTHSRTAGTVIKGEFIEGVTIYPNPNSGNFNISVADFKDTATATLYDYNGKKIKDFTLAIGENKIENDGLAQGTYIVVLTIDDQTDVKKILIK